MYIIIYLFPHLCPSECKHLSLRICWQFHYQHFHFSNPSPIYILIESPVSSCSKYMINHQYHQYIPSHPAFSVLPEAELASKYIVHLISYFPTVFLCHLSFDPKNIVWAVRSVQWSEENNICKTLPTHHDKRIYIYDKWLIMIALSQSVSDPSSSVWHQVICIWDIPKFIRSSSKCVPSSSMYLRYFTVHHRVKHY